MELTGVIILLKVIYEILLNSLDKYKFLLNSMKFNLLAS